VLYVVAGNGTGINTEITKALADLRDKAAKDSEDFWLLMEGKDEPSKADEAILAWIKKQDVWFEVVTATGTTYDGAQSTVNTEDVYEAFMERINERATDKPPEGSTILALPVTEEGDTDEDDTLMAFVETADDNKIPILLLNHQLRKIDLQEPAEEETEVPAPAKKATAKKAAAPAKKAPAKAAGATKKAAASAAEPEEEPEAEEELPEDAQVTYTEDELKKMGVPELSGLARGQGLDPKGLDKKTLIQQILGVTETQVAVEASKTIDIASLDGKDVLVIIVPWEKVAALLS